MKEQTIILAAFALLALAAVVPVLSVVVRVPEMQKPEKAETHYYRQNKTVQLHCQASGDSEYKWMKDRKPVDTSSTEAPISFDSKSGILTIPSYSSLHNGDYYCLATIGQATSMSQTQKLLMIIDGGFKNNNIDLKETTEYGYLSLVCRDQSKRVVAPGIVIYEWYIGEKRVPIDLDNGRLFISKTGDLYFTYVKESDLELYLCVHTSQGRNSIEIGSPIQLLVHPNTVSSTPARLRYSTVKTEVQIGNDATLECFFSGYVEDTADHLPTIEWSGEKGDPIPITDSKKFALSDDRRVLTVKDVKATDNQTFFCTGRTPFGNTDPNPNRLVVISKPRWKTMGPMKKTKPEGSDAKFRCDAESLKDPKELDPPVWYINGKAFQESFSFKKYTFSSDKKEMTIHDLVKPNDTQCIQCTVKNVFGTLMGDACLNVITPIKVTRQPPEEQKIKKGDIIDLTVLAVPDPDIISPLNYNWTINNVTYKRTNLWQYMTDNTTDIFINTFKIPTDVYDTLGGVFKIFIYNQYEYKELTTTIELLDFIPPAPVAASAGFDMWIIGLILGIVFLIVIAAIIIFVVCRKKQDGDYNVDKKEAGASRP